LARRRKNEGLTIGRAATGLVVGSVVIGAGGAVLGGIGGSTAAAAQGGLTTFASFTPVIATGLGSFIVVRQLQGLQGQVERQTKARRRR